MNSELLRVEGLVKHFPIQGGVFNRVVGHVKAVDGVSLDIGAGRTLALVGESGCGKTTVGKAILRLIEPSGGSARLGDTDIGSLSGAVAGGPVLGILEVMLQAYLPDAALPFRDAFVLSLVILILLFRPEGLIPAPSVRRS